MLSDLFVEKNRMNAFTSYVRDWKKQGPSTIERNGEIFSYRTKRGLVKRFIPAERFSEGSIRVQGFFFGEISEDMSTSRK